VDKTEVFKKLEEANKEGMDQLTISSALTKLAQLITQETIRVRLEAKEEDLNRRNPKRAAEKAAAGASASKKAKITSNKPDFLKSAQKGKKTNDPSKVKKSDPSQQSGEAMDTTAEPSKKD
jgi:regulator of replication initiation timing